MMKCDTNLEAGLKKIQSMKRPGMVIIHKSWCGVCKNLKPKFLASKEIMRLNSEFVFISLEDDAEPKDQVWLADGKYFPRIFFVSPSGRIMNEIVNTDGNPNFKYFYPNERTLLKSMERVLGTVSTKEHSGQQLKTLGQSSVAKGQVKTTGRP